MKYLIEFRVEGRGEFPMDMLRRDQAYPRTSDDAANLAFTHPEDIRHHARHDRQIELITWRDTKEKAERAVTDERWQSFGWRVVRVERSKV